MPSARMSSQTVGARIAQMLPIRRRRPALNTAIGIGFEAGRHRAPPSANRPRHQVPIRVLPERKSSAGVERFAAGRLDGRRPCGGSRRRNLRAAADNERSIHVEPTAPRIRASRPRALSPNRVRFSSATHYHRRKTWTSVVAVDEPMLVNRAADRATFRPPAQSSGPRVFAVRGRDARQAVCPAPGGPKARKRAVG